MKKVKVVAMALVLVMLLGMTVINVPAKTGDIIGYTKYTDIAAYINNYAILSFNVNDKTYVVAEDLANFGFDVRWDGESRSLYIERDPQKKYIKQYSVPYETEPSMVGKNAYPIIETDIKTYVTGIEVSSYNIDGKTIVDFGSLAAFGPIIWDGVNRTIEVRVEDGLEKRYTKQYLQSLPKTTLYSADGRSINVYNSEVDAYLKVGWYKTLADAQSAAYNIVYYPGTSIPTYDSVTGAVFKTTEPYGSGRTAYHYEYSEAMVNVYEQYLQSHGWSVFHREGEAVAYTKGMEYVIILRALLMNECWICPSDDGSNYSKIEYYPDTLVPKYESITGTKLAKTGTLNGIYTAYFYPFSQTEATNYLTYLESNGWILDDRSTDGIFLYNNNDYSVLVAFIQEGYSQYVDVVPLYNYLIKDN